MTRRRQGQRGDRPDWTEDDLRAADAVWDAIPARGAAAQSIGDEDQ